MGQHQADQQGLLLAGRGGGGGHVLGAVAHHEVGGLGAGQRPAGGAVAKAVLAQGGAVPVLGIDRRPDRHEVVDVAFQPHPGPGEGRGLVAGRQDQAVEALHGLAAGERHRDGEFRHLALHRVEPGSVVGPLLQQAVARAQGPLHRVDPGAVAGIDGEHQPVEKAAPVAGGAAKQCVEIGGEPDHPHLLGERRGGGGGGPVDAAEPAAALVAAPRRLPGGADAVVAVRPLQRE